MSGAVEHSRPGAHPGHRLADVRSWRGDLIARVDAQQAGELIHRGLIEPRGKHHYQAVDDGAVRLWAGSRTGGQRTTIGPQERSWHRALRGVTQ